MHVYFLIIVFTLKLISFTILLTSFLMHTTYLRNLFPAVCIYILFMVCHVSIFWVWAAVDIKIQLYYQQCWLSCEPVRLKFGPPHNHAKLQMYILFVWLFSWCICCFTWSIFFLFSTSSQDLTVILLSAFVSNWFVLYIYHFYMDAQFAAG